MKTKINARTSTKSTLFLNAAAIITAAFFLIPGSGQAKTKSSQRQQPTQGEKAVAAVAVTNGQQQNLASQAAVAVVADAPALTPTGAQRIPPSPNAITAGTYTFAASSGAALEDMSSSTALLLPADLDDTASNFGSIPFDFWFDGVRQNIFSVNANGLMRLGTTVVSAGFTNGLASTTDAPKISAYWDDLWIGTGNGKVHYKTVGTAPNRKLVVEWSNMQIPRVATATAGAGTFQVWLYESTGLIEFVYGSGIAANSANSGYSVGFQAGAATNFASVTTSSNTVSYATANDTNTGAITAGTKYSFTPNIPAAATGLNFTAVGLNTMTLNWTDAATNEFGYAIYRSLDGVNYEFVTQTAANATSSVQSVLASNTTYFWRVVAVSEGGQSSALAGSQATTTGTLSGTQNIGPTGTYPTITAAVAAVNASGLAGNLTLELQAAYTSGGETFPLVINMLGSPSNTITIRPESGAAGLSITSANATATVDLNTATNVTIDGRAGGVGPSQLTIANTNTAALAAVRLINAASRNTIQFCTITGVETGASNAVVLFGTSATGPTGNNNNNINNCDIRDGATTPINCVLGLGTVGTATLNTGNTITQNNVFNFHSATVASSGINANNGSNWTITNNRIFQTATRASTATITHRGILVLTQPGFDDTVSNNIVGFANSSGTGTYTMTSTGATGFTAIQLQGSITQTNNIQGNTVAGISMGTTTGALTGISVTGGSANVGTVTGNTVGSGTGNGSITVTNTTSGAFLVGMNASASTGHINIANNTIGSLTATGSATATVNLNVTQMTAGSMSITNNLFGSTTTPNSIQITTVGPATTAQQLLGMLSGSTNPLSIANNTMANLTNAGTSTGAVIRGIQYQSPGLASTNANGKASIVLNVVRNLTGANSNTNTFGNTVGIFYTTSSAAQPNGGLIDQNTVNTISATNAGAVNTVAGGIYMSNPAGAVVSNNKVYDIRNASTGTTATTPPVAYGIEVQAGSTFLQVHNNMVSLGNAQTTNTEFIGLWNNFTTIATVRSWFNSVHIEGAAAAGALPSYGFLRGDNTATSAITSPVDIKDSIFDNTRTGGTGKHYAIGNVNTVPATGWSAVASNNNVLNSAVAATVGIWGLATDETFANWKSASGGDGASLSGVSVVFVDAPNGDLHVNFGLTPTALESGGTTLAVTTDFDNQTRPGPAGSVNGGATAPDIGADEFDGVPLDISPPSISYTPIANTISTSDQTLTATIADATAVAAGANLPRLYFRKSPAIPYVSTQCSGPITGNAQSGTYNCTTDYSMVGGVTTNDIIQYFVVAQDTLGNLGSNPSGATGANVNSITFGGTPNSYTILPTISGTKTVGAGGGFDYPDLTSAIAALNSSVITDPGVIFELQDSMFTNRPGALDVFPLTINANSGSSATRTVTFRPKSGQTVSVTGSASTALFNLNGADWIIFDGSNNGTSSRDMTITNSNAGTSSAVIWMQTNGADGATNNVVKNCNLVGTSTTATAGTLIGVGSGSSTIGITSTGTGNNNNKYLNNNITKTSYGIYSGGASAANKNTGTVISGNVMNAASPNNIVIGGILVKFDNGTQVTNNTISGISFSGSFSSPTFGIALGVTPSNTFTAFTGSDVTNALVTGNSIGTVKHTGTGSSYGIVVNSVTSGTTLVANNMISGVGTGTNPTPSDFMAGILAGGGTGSTTQIYFNSVSMSGDTAGTSSSPSYALAIASGNPTVDVKDNIFFNTQTNTTGTGKHYAIANASTTFTNMTSSYNDMFVSGASSFIGQTAALGAGGTDKAALVDWQTATGQDASPNSFVADPVFVSTTDLHLTSNSSPAANAGTSIGAVTVDFDTNTRSAARPDIGADEVASNDLSNLVLSAGTPLVPPFTPGTTSYTLSVPNSTTSTTVTATVLDSNATVTVNGNPATSGSPFGPIALAVGPNTITVVVTPEFGPFVINAGTPKTYTVTVTRAASSNADLSNLVLSAGAIVPAFDPNTLSYTLSVPNATTSTTVTPTTADATATVTVNGNPVTSGSPSGSIALAVGPNTITTVVTAQDSTTKTYTVTVTRAASSNADLSNLVLSAGAIVPAFDANTTSYTLGVPYSTTSTTVTPTTADATATVTVNGNPVASGSPSGAIALAVGPNVITTVVTAQDSTMKTYTVTVTRAAASSNADLSNLVLSAGAIVPAFDANTTSYTLSVPNGTTSTTVTPTAADANATIMVNGNPVASGTPSGSIALAVGPNTITTVVSAQDETLIHAPATMKTYTVTVTRAAAASSNADLSNLTATAGPLSPAFDANTLSYTINVPFTTTSTTVTPTAADAGATITVNAVPVTSGSPSGSIALAVGNNTITTVVTAADTTTTKTYTINVIRGGQVVVTGSTGADGSYATVKLAFDALNANGTQAGNAIMVSITGDTAETAAAVLNQPATSSWTSLTITPSGARTVSGSLATPLIDLNGADNVTINGLNSAGNSLILSNTSTSATASTIRLINGTSSDTVTNCSVLGSSTGTVAAASGNILISTSTGGANTGNTISNNNIGPAAAAPALATKGVTSLGSASPNNNTLNVIDNNNIFDFFSPTIAPTGISLQANTTTTTVSNNRLYQTAPRVFTGAGLTYAGITSTIGTGAGTATITGNKVGFGAADGSGTTTISGSTNIFVGLNLTSSSTVAATSVQNNTVSGISQSTASTGTGSGSAFRGIYIAAGRYDVGTTTGNTVGSMDGSSTITFTESSTGALSAIYDFTSSSNTIANNNIGAITMNGTGAGSGFRGVFLNTVSAATNTLTNNTIGASGAGAITSTQTGCVMYAVQVSAGVTLATGNTIRNMSGSCTTAATIVSSGMVLTSTATTGGPNIISRNTIHSLSNNSGSISNSIYGLYCSFPAATANVVERNFVHSFSITSTDNTSQLVGILPVAGTGTYKNNMVRLGVNAAGASITPGLQVFGMFELAGTNNLYFNSVYIGGAGVVGTGQPSFGFVSNVTTGTRNYLDNIFWNARSNGSGTGNNYAISLSAITGATTNRNDLYASGTNGFVGRLAGVDQLTLANWQMATGQDAMSISANPQFVNPTGTAATVDLHINCASPADGAGTPVAGITTDFDNETRNATTPDIGADEINLTAPTLMSAYSSKMHGALGPFNIPLPGIECRTGGPMGNYQVVFTFSTSVTVSGAVVSSGTGLVSLVSGSGTNTITVDLTGVTNGQYLTVKLLCVDDTVNLGSVSATMGVLIGDVTGNGLENSSDVSATKMEVGNPVDMVNFRADVTANGVINSSDVSLVKNPPPGSLP